MFLFSQLYYKYLMDITYYHREQSYNQKEISENYCCLEKIYQIFYLYSWGWGVIWGIQSRWNVYILYYGREYGII